MSEKFTEFGLSTDSYAAFDATTLKALIQNRLSESDVFTDHVFEGSNLSSIIDIIAYSYHTLLFYLNRTASESNFTEAQLYENVNRIVKALSYNPSGYKSAVLTFKSSTTVSPGTYTIPRYSFVNVGGIKYSTNIDMSFGKISPEGEQEQLASLQEDYLLHQGEFLEYPVQTAVGEDFETVTLAINKDIKVDTHNIHVYVKSAGKWEEYKDTQSLFLESPAALSFEKRLNENKLYEIKFGNDTYGKKLQPGDQISIFYLKSDGDEGAIGANTLNGSLSPITTSTFLSIREQIKPPTTIYMSVGDMQRVQFTNIDSSTKPEAEESVDSIKTHAPKFFGIQHRLITADDFQNFIQKQYDNIVLDTKVVSNTQYIDGHLTYVAEVLGLQKPSLESRLLSNQVTFATSTNYNNVYIYAVPRFEKEASATPLVHFLTSAQRNFIINGLERIKVISSDPVIIDPVYNAIDIGAALPNETLTPLMRETSRLNLVKRRDSQRDSDTIKEEAVDIIKGYFGTSSRLGYLLDMNKLYSDLAAITDVVDIYMSRTDNAAIRIQGVTLLDWHPAYEKSDISIVSQNKQYPYYKFPYLYDPGTLISKIKVSVASSFTS